MDIEKEREAFEDWFSKEFSCDEWEYNPFSRMEFNDIDAYSCSTVNAVWSAWQAAKAQAVPDTNISFKDWISDHKNDYVHFGGYQERAHELANRAWNASANTSTPKDKVLMPRKLSTKHIDYVVKELAITGGISLIEEVYQCLIEAWEQANDS